MTGVGWLPREAADLFGEGAEAAESYGLLTVDVPTDGGGERWPLALLAARDELGCTYFDWLSAVDEPGTGLRICAHVVALGGPPRRLLLRTTVPHAAAAVPTATGVYPGAAWHERETHEMFGIDFPGHPGLTPLLLPDTFEGHPLRKDFVLAARVVKAWPGAKEPGESAHGGPKRRQMLPPGVPDPNEWGPLKGQLPDAPTRPARTRATGERPARRTRSASEGSTTQRAPAASEASPTEEVPPGERPRRTRSAGEGSASQRRARPEGDAGGPPDGPPGRRARDTPWEPPDAATTPDDRPGDRGMSTSSQERDDPDAPTAAAPEDEAPGTPPPGAAAPSEGTGSDGAASGEPTAVPGVRPGDSGAASAPDPVTPPPGAERRRGPAKATGGGPGRQPRGGPRAEREPDDGTDSDAGSDAADGGASPGGEGG